MNCVSVCPRSKDRHRYVMTAPMNKKWFLCVVKKNGTVLQLHGRAAALVCFSKEHMEKTMNLIGKITSIQHAKKERQRYKSQFNFMIS